MIQSVSGSPSYQSLQAQTTRVASPREGSSAAGSAFDIALQIQEVQYTNLERSLDAQTQLLDLLV